MTPRCYFCGKFLRLPSQGETDGMDWCQRCTDRAEARAAIESDHELTAEEKADLLRIEAEYDRRQRKGGVA